MQKQLNKKAIYWLLDDNNPSPVAASLLTAAVAAADCLAHVDVMKYDHQF